MAQSGLARIIFVAAAFSCMAVSQPRAQSAASEWDQILEAAKGEGKVVASIPPSPELRKSMELAFTRRYGIAVEFVPARGAAIIQRMVNEAKGGVHYFDLHIGDTEPIVSAMLPVNVLEPVEPFLIRPEVEDPQRWWGGHIWSDNAKRYIYNFVAYQTANIWSNPNLYKPAEFKSFDDLLHPKLQGRIGISDPRTSGSGSSMWSYMYHRKGEEYLRRLVAQRPFVTRDLRLLAEHLAKGKIAVASGIGYSEFTRSIKAKFSAAPLPVPTEGRYVTGGYGHLVVLKNLPHPNAAKVFINWLLGRDGQELFSRAMGVGTRRRDIDTKWLNHYGVMAAKDTLTIEQFYELENQSEDKFYRIRAPAAALARKLFG